jgi:predicted acylesterase/phospholipase RssA
VNFLSKDIPVRRSLLLAGGGVRLAYHAGVLIALEEEGLQFNHVDGASGGIFGTAMLASGISPKDAAARWRKLKLAGFVSMLPLKDYFSKPDMVAMGGSDGIRKKIYPALGIDAEKIRSNTSFDATFNVCNFSKKIIEAISNNEVTTDHLVAGMSLPVFMPGVKIGDDWYSDAVWIKDTNVTEALRRDAEEIWLVWCIGNTHDYLPDFFNQYVHMIEMSASGGLTSELEWMKQINMERTKDGLKPVKLHLIKPKYPLPLDPDFFLGKINADTLINMGYAAAKENLAAKKDFDWNQITSCTAMENAGMVLHFRQRFFGTVPLNNEKKKLQFNFSVFIYEPNHEAQLFASVMVDENEIISTFSNRVEIADSYLLYHFDLIFRQKIFHVQTKIRLHSKVDFLLGLDCKQAEVRLQSETEKLPATIFTQPAITRIKNSWQMNVRSDRGFFGKLKHRNMLLNFMFHNNSNG